MSAFAQFRFLWFVQMALQSKIANVIVYLLFVGLKVVLLGVRKRTLGVVVEENAFVVAGDEVFIGES